MPLVKPSSFRVWPIFSNGHLQTILPNVFRTVRGVRYGRQRIETPDGDFLDLDWALPRLQQDRLAIVSHGLEGDTSRTYVLGMVKALQQAQWDVVAWNARGCSGEVNRLLRFTHSGASEDLESVISATLAVRPYSQVALVGFSLGGNITLKYVGERQGALRACIHRAVAISSPCDLLSGSKKLAASENQIYMRRFLKGLRGKIRQKMVTFPGQVDDTGYEEVRTFGDFDGRYTAPIHGFASAEDYWEQSSSVRLLHRIEVRSLLLNALNDPFLAPECFPWDLAREHPYVHLEAPASGGHNGFAQYGYPNTYWAESRTVEFLERGH